MGYNFMDLPCLLQYIITTIIVPVHMFSLQEQRAKLSISNQAVYLEQFRNLLEKNDMGHQMNVTFLSIMDRAHIKQKKIYIFRNQ